MPDTDAPENILSHPSSELPNTSETLPPLDEVPTTSNVITVFTPSASAEKNVPFHEAAESGYEVRALNPDNAREGERTIELFEAHYQNSYPDARVYTSGYWTALDVAPDTQLDGESGFEKQISFHIQRDDQYLAHATFLLCSKNRCGQLLHLAVHPSHREELAQFSKLFGQWMEEHARREQWRYLFSAIPVREFGWQILATRYSSMVDTAVLPLSDPRVDGGFIISSRSFATGTEKNLTFHVLPNYCAFIQESAVRLGYEPYFELHSASRISPQSIPGDVLLRQCDRLRLPSVRCYHVLSTRGEEEAVLLSTLFDRDSLPDVIRVDAHHPKTPLLCRAVEQYGFHFSGWMPDGDGASLFFTRYVPADLRQLRVVGPEARALVEFLQRAYTAVS